VLGNKSWRKKKEGEEFKHLYSQVTVMLDGALICWRWLNTCLPPGSFELIPYFAFLAHAVAVLLYVLNSYHQFSCFHPSSSLPCPTEED